MIRVLITDATMLIFWVSGEMDLLPCATKTEYPWMERRATCHGFHLLIVKGEPPVRARAIRRAIHHCRACDRGHKSLSI